MKKKRIAFSFRLFIAFALVGLVCATSFGAASLLGANQRTQQEATPKDTAKVRFNVKRTTPISNKDLDKKMLDLRDPENIKSEAEYDNTSGSYLLGSKIGDNYLNIPILMTSEEYKRYSLQKSMNAYFRSKNDEEFKNKGKEKFDFTNMKFNLGMAEKIFGPGGVQIKTQGSAELKIGANTKNVDNPSLPIRQRNTFGFDFNEKVNVSVNAKVGDKLDMNLNYNSDATFDFDTENLKLKYEGKEDEIIKLIEAGNISMPTNSSLIRGASSLFGVRADMQFGKLKLQTVISQKKSTSKNVSASGGTQLTTYDFSADNYEENRHFFLSHFFRKNYDDWMSKLPNISSGVTINRVEIWVTNKSGTTSNTRNIVAFTDLAENTTISNSIWTPDRDINPSNKSNNLYATISTQYSGARNISQVNPILGSIAGFEGGEDFEKLESARLLSTSEYTLNTALGYVSLKSTLQTDQVLAIAYEYTYRGQTYQVGEFANDIKDNTQTLFVKALKNTSNTPQMGNWKLMMKNVYSLGATSVQKEKFKMDIKILSDTTGVYLSYLPEPGLRDKTLLKLLNLDRLDNNNNPNPNGYFDFVNGYTIDASTGRIYFPVTEPFGSYLTKVINDPTLAKKYVFQELYDSTKTIAKQIAEKNKYTISGRYKGSSRSSEIQLGSTNIPQGSVIVTAGGSKLTENSDYTVDYNAGVVTIINQSIIDAGTSINASLESNENFGLQRKTMLGMNWAYDFTKNFQMGGTIMHLSEQALTTKVSMGSEPLNNTIWGLNLSWKQESQWLTNIINKLPFINCTAPSSINLSAEFAQLIAGKNSDSQGNASYVDDFENTKSGIDISLPNKWVLSSTPSLFPESKYANDLRYGYNRALMSWYNIDPLFTRRSSSLTPSHIKSDLNQLSNHYVREVYKRELFPNRDQTYGETTTMSILNLAYYPNERGPYNLNPQLDRNGRLENPMSHWGGMMTKLETSDFETANIEYIEFWMLDPFIYSREKAGNHSGDFYINLGEISEDILKDGKKYCESSMPIDNASTQYTETVWGRIPYQSSVTYAFNTSNGSRQKQDVGLNGLSSAEEASFGAYRTYLNTIMGKINGAAYDSIVADPAGDDYHYFRGSDYDAAKASILDRYKHINSPEGNSVDSKNSPENYSTAYKTTPDVEDVNQDYTLNEYEKYYQYHVRFSPDSMKVGTGYIVDERTANVTLRNGNKETVKWFLYRIPLAQYQKKEGNITDFSSIRFMRMFLTNFQEPIVLRFGTLELVRGEWRNYEQALYTGTAPSLSGNLNVSAVSIEENNTKTPVNYVLPPGISRNIDPNNSQLKEDNEQALSITVTDLASNDARAVYKNTMLDLRQYKHLQMFVHANAITGDASLENGQTSMFIRFGSDYKNNFYEYEIPLTITPEGKYDTYSTTGCKAVWPEENMLDIDLSAFTNVKKERNKEKALGLSSYSSLYSVYDANKPNNKISVLGNPTLGEIRTVMIGIRNKSRAVKNVEMWVNELRLQEYTNDGGWAAKGNLNLQLSDLASVNVTGHIETSGFGGLEESVSQRRKDNLYEYSITTNLEAGKFFPEKAKVQAPIYYSYSKEKSVPLYNPLDTDMKLEDALDACVTKKQKDSLENICVTTVVNSNFSISNAKIGIATKRHPMPYDPANFSFSYSHSHKKSIGETTMWEKDDNWKWNMNYSYSPVYKTFQPFKNIKNKSNWLKIIKDQNVNILPQNITINSDILRSYYELQERDMENLQNNSIPLTWASDFLWNRSLSLRWDLTKNLHMDYSSATNAEIVQPYTPVNKDLYPDSYSAWKDSVWRSIMDLGRPLSYQQTFKTTWRLPINKIPVFDWITSDWSYDATYQWARGTELEDGSTLGNTIANSRIITGNARFNMETLYNHIPFLKATNKRFLSNSNSRPLNKDKKKNFEKEIQLKSDTTTTIKHNLKNKRIKVIAIRQDGKRFPIKYKVTDANTINILTRDTTKLKLTVIPGKDKEDGTFYKTMQCVARTAMMIRNLSITYRNSYNMSLPGFIPNVGDIFGQRSGNGLQPGLDFAFGLTGDSYIKKAYDNGWLSNNDSITTPATTNANEDLQIRVTLEPFRDFKIDLNANRTVNKAQSIQYMYEGMPTTKSGSFTMTTISIGSAFESFGNADNGFQSKTFSRFVSSLEDFRNRLEQKYTGIPYPVSSSLAGHLFNPANGTVNKYSADVMIPAFLAAYCGGNRNSSLDIFPTLKRLLPNWRVTYSGLIKIPWFNAHFKSFNINHAYKSIYAVGSYSSYTSYMAYRGDLGFIKDVTTGNPVPSSPFDISSVSINESFSPLFGVDMTFNNNLTAKLEYKRTRILNLSMTSLQINETRSSDWVIGLGYKINDFKLFGSKKKKRIARSNKSKNAKKEEPIIPKSTGMNNDLNLRVDFSIRDQSALNRDISTLISQATSGNKALKISFSADYTVSKLLTLSAYYDRQTMNPLLSSSSYPTTTQDFGISMKFSLTR
ncbi:MAG: cell surface protein SprA [Bacteroidaceae bacterium]